MKKALSVFIIITIIMSVFITNTFAMVPITAIPSEDPLLEGTTLTEMMFDKTNVLTFVPTTYDDSITNGVDVTGIGGKTTDDKSVQIFSRVKTGATDNFRMQFNFNTAPGGTSIIPAGSDSIKWFSDLVIEFKIMPNEHITKMEITDRSNVFASITGLSTTEWTNVKIIIDSANLTSCTFVNGVLHTTNSSLSKGTKSKYNAQYLRIVGYTTVPDEFQEQSGIQKDSDVWFYFDDFKVSSATISTPVVYLNETESFDLSKGGRIKNDDGSNEVADGVYGKATTDKVFKMVANTTATDPISWYGQSNSADPVVTDLTATTVDTVYETSFAVPEDVISVQLMNNNEAVVSLDKDELRINQWNKVKAVYNPSTSGWKVYLNGEYYGTSSAAFTGRYKLQIQTPVGQSSTFYADSIKVYQAAEGVEAFEEVTLKLPATYETDNTETVADIKNVLGIKEADNATFYADATYTTMLADTDIATDGTVIVAQNTNEIFQYCTISGKVHGSLVYSGTAKYSDTQFTTGTLTAKAYSEVNANLYIAQYDVNGKLIDLAVSETKTGTIALNYEPVDTEGKLKIFLWDWEHKPISESIVLDYQRSMDVLIIGNSFARDTLFYTRDIAKEFDIDITMGLAYNGGKDLEWYYDNREASALKFYRNDFGGRQIYSSVSLNSILTDTDYDWDVIILQNYIAETYEQASDTIWTKAVSLAEYVNELVPDAELKLNMVWSNEIGWSKMTSEELQNTTDEYLSSKNYQLAADIKTALNLDYDVDVVPVGTAVATARDYVDEAGLNVFGATYYAQGHIDLGNTYVNDQTNKTYVYEYGVMSDEQKNAGMIRINRDGFHLTPIARYLSSAIWFEALTGESIMDSTFTPPEDTNLGCLVCPTGASRYYLYGIFVAPDSKYVNIMKNIAHNAQQ